MKKILVLISIMILGLYSCEEESTSAITQEGVLMPLALGNTWIYKYSILDTNNQVIEQNFDTLTVIKDTIINGNTFFGCSNGRFYRNTSWGLEMYFEFYTGRSFNPNLNYYKFPTNPNENWILLSYDDNDISSGNLDSVRLKFTTLNLNSQVTVPKGTFNTIKYKHEIVGIDNKSLIPAEESPAEPFEQYYAPNIGAIKSIHLIRQDGYKEKLIFELVDYKLY